MRSQQIKAANGLEALKFNQLQQTITHELFILKVMTSYFFLIIEIVLSFTC